MKSKTILITGAARRIGAAIARHLHREGMTIIIHYNHALDEAKTLENEFNRARSGSGFALQGDLTQSQGLPSLVEQALGFTGQLHGLINNASIFMANNADGVCEATWSQLLDCNLKAPYFLSQLCYPHLKKSSGAIINITDIYSERPLKNYSVYSISKAGLAMATKTLAKEFAPHVRVNAIAPGTTLWPEANNELSMEIKDEIIQRIPLNRQGDPAIVAKTAQYLLEDATYMTGQSLTLDGGRLLN